MSNLEQFRDPDLSLWQSAVDEVVAKRTGAARAESVGGPAVIQRPDTADRMVHGALIDLKAEHVGKPLQPSPVFANRATEGLASFAQFCSKAARDLAIAKIKGDAEQVAACKQQFSNFGQCDPGWLEVAEKYAEFQLQNQPVPYRTTPDINRYVIDGKLPANATVAIIGDWGTGLDAAKKILSQIARKKPDVVIHLGDIYYSCTDFEAQNYFLNIWKQYFDITKVASFTLAGNHDMFPGGGPFYKLIDQLGQPASYFSLQNQNWQFVAIDTGLHDRTPAGTVPTFLEDTEVAWLKQRIAAAGGRKTVLLSHHQLFSRFEDIAASPDGMAVNTTLNNQIGALLPQIEIWLWGHEHDLVVYKKQLGVLACCIGHGAFPIPINPPKQVKHPEITAEDISLDNDGRFYAHGYSIIKLNGANATISQYQDTDEDKPLWGPSNL
jgi:Calcineurin-like phosphoesterase